MVMNPDELKEAGIWIVQLKTILGQGPTTSRDVGNRPQSEHRSTKTAVKLLLSNLRKGVVGKQKTTDTTDDDIDKVVFNAVNLLIEDKDEKSKKSKLEVLKKFETVVNQERNKKGALDASYFGKINNAIRALRVEEQGDIILNRSQEVDADTLEQFKKDMFDSEEGTHALAAKPALAKAVFSSMDSASAGAGLSKMNQVSFQKFDFGATFGDSKNDVLAHALDAILKKEKSPTPEDDCKLHDILAKKMLDSKEGKEALTANPRLAGAVLGSMDPAALKDFDFGATFGDSKNKVLAEALIAITNKESPKIVGFVHNRLTEVDSKLFTHLKDQLLSTAEGKEALKNDPVVAGVVLSSMDPTSLDGFDFDKEYGGSKNRVLAEALVAMGNKSLVKGDKVKDRVSENDPKLFTLLMNKLDVKVWNDQTATAGALKGLGPRVCLGLWQQEGYDQICELIGHGVDTSLASRVDGERGVGTYSGFVQPVQFLVSKLLSDVAIVKADENKEAKDKESKAWEALRKKQAAGAQKILAKLGDKAVMLTDYESVKKSEMIDEFKKNPGTIWGFEDIRMPFVQAAHEEAQKTTKGDQPLRMMELWKAVEECIETPEAYNELLDDPKKAADKFVAIGVSKIEGKESEEFIQNFKKDAKAFLLEFAAQMPKGTFARGDPGDKDGKRVSEAAGIVPGKFLGGLACKAGLWWAKNEKKPVYYCLDGIKMDFVTNYKKVKNKAVEDFISGDGKGHDEVITLVELREILKNWDQLKDTVKFVRKGEILAGEDLKTEMETWQANLKKTKEDVNVGRTPAPDFKTFTNELNKIDDSLYEKLTTKAKDSSTQQANLDARDIVKKYGYLVKVANTRPHIALKYITSKCEVLREYKLISDGLIEAAKALKKAADEKSDLKAPSKLLRTKIKECHKDFQKPLEAALVVRFVKLEKSSK
jgi:hypothetical protein